MAQTVFLSAGHDEIKPGAVANGYIEARLTVELRDAVAEILAHLGVNVLMDGQPGRNRPLRDAIQIAQSNPNGLNIEFHFNGSENLAASGVEVLASLRNKQTAQAIAQAIARATGSPLRGERGYKPENSGQHHRLGFVQAGGLVVEVAFITNRQEMLAYRQNFHAVAGELAETIAAIAGVETAYAAPVTPTSWTQTVAVQPFEQVAPVWQPPVSHGFAVSPETPRLTLHSALIGKDWLTTLLGYGAAFAEYFANPTKGGAVLAAILAVWGRASATTKK